MKRALNLVDRNGDDLIFRKRPRKRGKLRLPLVASIVVEYLISANKEQTKFQVKG